MRVLVAHDVPGSRTGGMNRIMAFTHDRLATRGYDVDYCHAEDVASGRAMRRLAFPLGIYARARRAARAGHPYHLLNIHEPSAVPSVLGAASLGRPRIVVTTHGLERRAWELALEERRLGREGPGLKSRIVYPLTSLWQSWIGLTRADHVLCLNEEDRQYLIDRLGVLEHRVTRIFPGADQLYADASAQRRYERAERLVFAGTWRKNKGIEDLVPAFSELRRLHPRLELVVLGSGVPDRQVLQAFPEAVRDGVSCASAANDVESARQLGEADIFVLPSLFEGTPLTLVEGMASGLPIVTTAVCGMKDLIVPGQNGLLVPIRSPQAIVGAVRELLESPDLRRRLGTAARRDALTQYTWDRAADRIGAAYDRLVGRQGNTRMAS